MKYLLLLPLIINSLVLSAQNCNKYVNIQTKETNPHMETNRVIFDKPSIIEHKDLYFKYRNHRIYVSFELTFNYTRNYPDGSEITLKFDNESSITLVSSNSEINKIGTTHLISFDCQLTDRDQFDLFYLHKLNTIYFRSRREPHKISSGKARQLNTYFHCLSDQIDISEINYEK